MEKNKKTKSAVRIWVEYILFIGLFQLLEILPMPLAMFMASKLFRVLSYLDIRHRQRTISHIIYSGVETDPAKAKALANVNFEELGKLLVEMAKMKKMYSFDRFTLTGSEIARNLVAGTKDDCPQQFIFVTAHYGNWEIAGTAIADINRKKIVSMMRAFENPLIGKRVIRQRTNKNHSLSGKEQGLRPVIQAFKDGKSLAIVVDQHAVSNEGVEVEFFGHPARHHKTPALLHLKTGFPIVPILIHRINNKFEFECIHGDPIVHESTGDRDLDVAMITQRVSWQIEDIIRMDPSQWLWAPRHWLSLDRRCSKDYADWKPRFTREELCGSVASAN